MSNGMDEINSRENRFSHFSKDTSNKLRYLLYRKAKIEGREEAIKSDLETMIRVANEIAMVPSWRSVLDDNDVRFINSLLDADRDKKWIIILE